MTSKVRTDITFIRDFFKKQGCTLITKEYKNNNQILEYWCSCGDLSTTRWRSFYNEQKFLCRRCSTKKAMDTNRKNHKGLLYFQTREFLTRRSKTIEENLGVPNAMQSKEILKKREGTNLKRYGVRHVSQDPTIKDKQRQGFIAKYGVPHFMYNPESKKKFLNTLRENHGVESLAALSRSASKQSQGLFWEIMKIIPESYKAKVYFAEHRGEYVASVGRTYYKYDFVCSLSKKAIEYNGTRFHPRPEQQDSETGWCVFHPELSVAEARQKEKEKLAILQSRGYKVRVVWDTEYLSNPQTTAIELAQWITQGNP